MAKPNTEQRRIASSAHSQKVVKTHQILICVYMLYDICIYSLRSFTNFQQKNTQPIGASAPACAGAGAAFAAAAP